MMRQTGGLAIVGHLDQVEVVLTGELQRLGQRLDAELLPVGADQANLTGPDAVVDPGLVVGRRALLSAAHSCRNGLPPGSKNG